MRQSAHQSHHTGDEALENVLKESELVVGGEQIKVVDKKAVCHELHLLHGSPIMIFLCQKLPHILLVCQILAGHRGDFDHVCGVEVGGGAVDCCETNVDGIACSF